MWCRERIARSTQHMTSRTKASPRSTRLTEARAILQRKSFIPNQSGKRLTTQHLFSTSRAKQHTHGALTVCSTTTAHHHTTTAKKSLPRLQQNNANKSAAPLTACSSSSSVALKSDSTKSPANEPCAPLPPLKNVEAPSGNTWCAEEHDCAKARLRDSFSAASLESPGTPKPCKTREHIIYTAMR